MVLCGVRLVPLLLLSVCACVSLSSLLFVRSFVFRPTHHHRWVDQSTIDSWCVGCYMAVRVCLRACVPACLRACLRSGTRTGRYEEIAKLQKQIFLLKEEAEEYEAAHAPTEAELWVRTWASARACVRVPPVGPSVRIVRLIVRFGCSLAR